MINGIIVLIGYKYSIYGEQSTYMELIKNKNNATRIIKE